MTKDELVALLEKYPGNTQVLVVVGACLPINSIGLFTVQQTANRTSHIQNGKRIDALVIETNRDGLYNIVSYSRKGMK